MVLGNFFTDIQKLKDQGNSAEELISAKEIIRRAYIVNSSVDRIEQHYVGVNYSSTDMMLNSCLVMK